jgi:hypothetical protein
MVSLTFGRDRGYCTAVLRAFALRSRQALLVVLMATVLCTERIATAAPGLSPQIGRTVRQLAVKLTDSFQQSLPNIRPQQSKYAVAAVDRAVAPSAMRVVVHPVEITPFQFRLPPPTQC